jgi:hypothetical protein
MCGIDEALARRKALRRQARKRSSQERPWIVDDPMKRRLPSSIRGGLPSRGGERADRIPSFLGTASRLRDGVPMVAAASRHDELPTTQYHALKRSVPPPVPPPVPSKASRIPQRFMLVQPPGLVPRPLRKGRLTIELPLEELNEQEIAQISAWLQGRSFNVHVRHNLAARAAARIVIAARAVRARVREAVHTGLIWTLSRVSDTEEPALARASNPEADSARRSIPD